MSSLGSNGLLQVHPRLRAAKKMAMGAVLAMTGFGLSFMIEIVRYFYHPRISFYGDEFKSGNGYWPSTVSEAIHDTESAEGKIFFALCLIGAILVWTSEYPYMLWNVSTDLDIAGGLWCCGFPVYWSSFRQFIPQMGLLLLVCVPTVPIMNANQPYDGFAQVVHLIGATLMFVGYLLAEFKCLGDCGFTKSTGVIFVDGEYKLRRLLARATLVSFVSFIVLTGFEYAEPYLGICCADEFVKRGHIGPDGQLAATGHILNTASGKVFWIKVAEYAAEVLTGSFALASHFCIAYYGRDLRAHHGELELGVADYAPLTIAPCGVSISSS